MDGLSSISKTWFRQKMKTLSERCRTWKEK